MNHGTERFSLGIGKRIWLDRDEMDGWGNFGGVEIALGGRKERSGRLGKRNGGGQDNDVNYWTFGK